MATDLNTVGIVGRIVRDIELDYTKSGIAYINFTIAVNKSKKVNGKYQNVASYFDCSAFGKLAESLSAYLIKGQQVAIKGSLDQQTWEANGQKRSKIVIIAEGITLIGGKPNERNENASKTVYNSKSDNFTPKEESNAVSDEYEADDDIPF